MSEAGGAAGECSSSKRAFLYECVEYVCNGGVVFTDVAVPDKKSWSAQRQSR